MPSVERDPGEEADGERFEDVEQQHCVPRGVGDGGAEPHRQQGVGEVEVECERVLREQQAGEHQHPERVLRAEPSVVASPDAPERHEQGHVERGCDACDVDPDAHVSGPRFESSILAWGCGCRVMVSRVPG